MSSNHLTRAEEYLSASRAAQGSLKASYASPDRDTARIGSLHQAINYGLKAAEVSALIGIGQQLEALVKARS